MRKITYLFVFAIVLLVFKAFFLDEYIARNYGNDANGSNENDLSAEANTSSVPAQPEVKPQPLTPVETKPVSAENAPSATPPEKQETKETPEDKKMPLDKLGDSISKHIKL